MTHSEMWAWPCHVFSSTGYDWSKWACHESRQQGFTKCSWTHGLFCLLWHEREGFFPRYCSACSGISHDLPGILGILYFSFIFSHVKPRLQRAIPVTMSLPLVLQPQTPVRHLPPLISVVGDQELTVGSLCSESTHHHIHFFLARKFDFRDTC